MTIAFILSVAYGWSKSKRTKETFGCLSVFAWVGCLVAVFSPTFVAYPEIGRNYGKVMYVMTDGGYKKADAPALNLPWQKQDRILRVDTRPHYLEDKVQISACRGGRLVLAFFWLEWFYPEDPAAYRRVTNLSRIEQTRHQIGSAVMMFNIVERNELEAMLASANLSTEGGKSLFEQAVSKHIARHLELPEDISVKAKLQSDVLEYPNTGRCQESMLPQ